MFLNKSNKIIIAIANMRQLSYNDSANCGVSLRSTLRGSGCVCSLFFSHFLVNSFRVEIKQVIQFIVVDSSQNCFTHSSLCHVETLETIVSGSIFPHTD